ncbi:MAG: HesA/MoeB/ThiF family protein [Deltaproteobacteria bacterium]|nr:MAG: HesA/MoeB/ThiF family protein [Deltaproteobacteria bacterium]
MNFDHAQLSRWSRQMLLDEIGATGQAALARARVLLIGVGGLGSPVALYLAGAGVGHLTLLDPDRVAPDNLHRQILFRETDLGRAKVERARLALAALDASVEVEARQGRFTRENARPLVSDHDLVIDGSDDFETRFLANDTAVELGRPLVHGAVVGFHGQVMVVGREGGCYRCLFEAPPPPGEVPPCAEAGVLGPAAGVIGSVMACEALKVLTGAGTPLTGRLWIHDALAPATRIVPVPPNPECRACRHRRQAA